MSGADDPTYLLVRDQVEACRLASQHLLLTSHAGYTLHPDIEIKDGMKVADLGTGTGIWALELATQLPRNVQICCYDISGDHYPTEEYWPSNVTFDYLDSMGDVPKSLSGTFDVVHLRMWAHIPRNDDPTPLIRHAANLLKPGGYLQWEDARFSRFVARGEAALKVRTMLDNMHVASRLKFQWLEELDQRVQNSGMDFQVLDCQYRSWQPYLLPLVFNLSILAMQNFGGALETLKKVSPSVPTPDEWTKALADLSKEELKPGGGQLYWLPVLLLAQKSIDSGVARELGTAL